MQTPGGRERTSFGPLLRRLRVTCGLTQDELSHRSGLTARGIRRLEAGDIRHPRLHTVELLAQAMQLDPADRASLLAAARPELAQTISSRSPDAGTTPAPRVKHHAGVLPAPLTPFVGRNEECESIRKLLIDDRVGLLTITGAPGIGKTRLAIEAGRSLMPHYEGNVWFVSLAPVSDPYRVIPVIIETLGAAIPGSGGTPGDLARAIGAAKMLLLLDNMEHLLEAATDLPPLLAYCPNLQIMATSRGRLRVSGEQNLPIAPLSVPERREALNGNSQLSDAEELFRLHAQAVDPLFTPVLGPASPVAVICRRLDGLPLAIELAAAQLGERSIDDLAAHLDHVLPILEGGPRDQPARLQTMTNSLEWSYSLLSPQEQRLLRLLAVFMGGFTRSSAVELASIDDPDPSRAERLLFRLVEKGLVSRAAEEEGIERLMLLEVVREFAARKLQACGEEDVADEAHASHFLALAVSNEIHNWIPGDPILPVLFELELANFRKAMQWLERAGRDVQMLNLAATLRWFWTSRVDLSEGQMWLERAIASAPNAPAVLRSKSLLALGQIHFYRGGLADARHYYQQAFDAAIAANDDLEIASSGSSAAALAVQEGQYVLARTRGEQALAACQRIADPELAGAIAHWLPGTLARAEHGLGNLDRADKLFRSGAEQFLALDHPRGATRVLSAWGTLAADRGDWQTAFDRYQQALRHAVRSREPRWMVFNLKMLSAVLAQADRYDDAVLLLEAVAAFEERYGDALVASPMDHRIEEMGRRALRTRMSAHANAGPPPTDPSALLDSATSLALSLDPTCRSGAQG